MRTGSELKLICLAAILLLFLTAGAASAESIEDDLRKITELEKEMRLKSVALLSVIKKMGPVEEAASVERVKLIAQGCDIYESMDESSRVLYQPIINDEFDLLAREDEFYKIRLQDGREGWILESCVQVFKVDREVEKPPLELPDPGQTRRYMNVAFELHGIIQRKKLEADAIARRYLDDSGKPRSESPVTDVEKIGASYRKIEKYADYASYFYDKYVEGLTPYAEEKSPLKYRFSGTGEILFGSSDFTTKRENQADITDDGSTRNIAFGGDLSIDERSRLSFGFSRKKEILQTPFNSTELNAAYNYRPPGGVSVDTRLRYHKYSDETNQLNDYGRLSLGARANLLNTGDRTVYLDYTFLNNDYSESDDDDYISNRIRAEAKIKPDTKTDYVIRLDSNFETSDALFHKFVHLVPAFSLVKHRPGGSLAFTGSYEMLNYSDAGLKSYNKAGLELKSSRLKDGERSNKSLGLFYKQFPDNDVSTYFQARGRLSSSRTGVTSRRISAAFYSSIFTENTDVSFTDLRFDAGGSSRKTYGNVSTFVKLWHSPGEKTDSTSVRPHVLDVYGKVGAIVGGIRVGPTFGLHTLVSEGEKLLKRDGNVFRVGGSAEGTFSLPHRISLTMALLYESGFVYNSQILDVDQFGNTEYGEAKERHPTTFQLNLSVQAPITEDLELTVRTNTYKLKTDMSEEISRDPVTENNRFSMLAGLRYRYN